MVTLKQLRERRLLTQAELAERVGVTSTTLSYWETGRRRPYIKHMRKLVEVLNVSADELLAALDATQEEASRRQEGAV